MKMQLLKNENAWELRNNTHSATPPLSQMEPKLPQIFRRYEKQEILVGLKKYLRYVFQMVGVLMENWLIV